MTIDKKTITATAPSNIAFVKYWGKTGRQEPINPSISMTLSECVTKCTITYQERNNTPLLKNYTFEGQTNASFSNRIERYLSSIIDICPSLNDLSISIESENTFPHSAGIASSASAFAAIAYGIAQVENNLGVITTDQINKRASTLARLGSGSACRSIDGPYTTWGKDSNDHASKLNDIHSNFTYVSDTILLINSGEKQISSSAGHALMNNHPFRQSRIEQAVKNTNTIIHSMRTGDWETFGNILENEALTLHAMMMSSSPSFILLAPNSLTAIECIREFRRETNIPLYFTIDAGPNIHLIYPSSYADKIDNFIQENLSQLCENGQCIIDKCGGGANVSN